MTYQQSRRPEQQQRFAAVSLLFCSFGLLAPAAYSQESATRRPALSQEVLRNQSVVVAPQADTTIADSVASRAAIRVNPTTVSPGHADAPLTSAAGVSPSVRALAERTRIDPVTILRGDTVAVVNGRREAVTLNNLTALASSNALIIERVRPQAIADKPSLALLDALQTARPDATMKLSYELSAKMADNTRARIKVFAADKTGLLLDVARDAYVGTFAVALDNSDQPGDRSALADPIDIGVRAPGASAIAPAPVRIARLSEWTDVEVVVPDPRTAAFPVVVSASPGDEGDSIQLAVTRPRFILSGGSASVIGWGLGTTGITVTSRGMRSPAGFIVPLTVAGGALDVATVQLDARGTGKAMLRSDTSPESVIRIGDPDLAADALTVSFRSPFAFLAAAILGGLLGAYLRGKGRKKWPKALTIGMGGAVLMTVGQAVGFTEWITTALGVSNLASSGEAVVFFLGAIAALVGVSLLIPGATGSRKKG